MTSQRLLYRAGEVEVWRTAHVQGGGRLVLVWQVWCVAAACQDRGRLATSHLPDQAISLADRHEHRLLHGWPAATSRARRSRAFLGLSAALFVASFLLAATWAALLIHPVTSLPATP